MKNLFLTAVLTLSFSNLSQAMTIEDPNSILEQVEFFKEGRSFTNEFKIGDAITALSQSCWSETDEAGNTSSGCDGTYIDTRVEGVTLNSAYFSNNYALSRGTYEKLNRNPFNLLIEMNEIQNFMSSKNMTSDKTVMKLDSYTESFSSELGVNTMNIKFSMVYTGEGYELVFPMYIVLAQGLPFMGQIAEFSFDKDHSDAPAEWETMYQVVDWVKFL
ncbi:MAG: hypothetical protein ACJAS4_003259 [Bacteriovoracaceae bacterium]|jgi:hypothetical protein